MIRYALACSAGHDFESWFRSSDDFERQDSRGLVTCPVCGSAKVQKQIMAPQVARTDLVRTDLARASTEHTESPQPRPSSGEVALIDSSAQELRRKIAEFRAHLIANSENVGDKFAEEARKIHYGESEERSIYGKATGEDARALADEGIGFLPVPELPEDRN